MVELLSCVPLLIAIAFLTVAERKLLAAHQLRLGPEELGVVQPFADALKLLMKETIIPARANKMLYLVAPVLTLTLALIGWAVIPWGFGLVLADVQSAILYLMAISTLSIYGLLGAGWSSNSTYALLGAMRATAQMVSYEVAMGLIILAVVITAGSLSLTQIVKIQSAIWLLIPLFPAMLMHVTSMLAETNRTPFDLPEGESELVSGYNVEYSSMTFALFFLGEYLHIMLMSYLFTLMFLGGWQYTLSSQLLGILVLTVKAVGIMAFFIWVRATLPRYRYDQLMHLLWKAYLPLTIPMLLLIPLLLPS